MARHTVYASFGGNGLYPSLGYDLRWPVGRNAMSVGIGAFYLPSDGSNGARYPLDALTIVPVQWNHALRLGGTWSFEYGAGVTYSKGGYMRPSNETLPPDLQGLDIYSESLHVLLKPGSARIQAHDGGMFLRVYGLVVYKWLEMNPDLKTYLDDPDTDPEWNFYTNELFGWFGIDVGYTFRSGKPANRK
jgi:hypothetical protein